MEIRDINARIATARGQILEAIINIVDAARELPGAEPPRKQQAIVVFETVDVGGLARSLRERYPQMTQIVQGYHFKVVHRDSGKELGEE